MKKQADRRAIVISAVLTLLILLGIGGVVWLQGNSPVAAAGDGPASAAPGTASGPSVAPLTVDGAATPVDDPVVAAYQAKLQEAYQALNEAYTQIDALQAAQGPASAQLSSGHDDAREHDDQAKSFSKEHDDHERDDHGRDNG